MTSQPMSLPRRQGTAAVRRRRLWRLWLSDSEILFIVFTVLYLAVAVLLVRHDILFADAMSRVVNAYYVLFSRDPHLPAIGFVWNPLPSLVLLPILPLKSVAPWLVTHGFAGRFGPPRIVPVDDQRTGRVCGSDGVPLPVDRPEIDVDPGVGARLAAVRQRAVPVERGAGALDLL